MQILFPSPALQPFIKRYVVVSTSDETITNTLLPDTSISLAFRLRGTTSYVTDSKKNILPSSVITGLRTGPRVVKYEPNSTCIIVAFQPFAATNFFHKPLHDFFDSSIALREVLNRTNLSIAEESLQTTNNFNRAITIIEEFLLSNLSYTKPDKLVHEAVRLITKNAGQIRMRDLADELCISHDAFEKRFRKMVGSSAKHFARTIRLRMIVNQKPTSPITSLALDAGYFDSAHFSKDFKSFTGESPSKFFKHSAFW